MEKVIIVCPEHGEFLQEPNSHINHKTGCPYCGRTKKKTIEEFISIAKKIHGNRYNYDKVNYINGNSKVIIICPIHGKFLQSPDDHINQKSGCSSCSGVKKLTTKEFITKAKKIHGNYYDYSKVNYINSQKNITIICPIHGDFSQRPNSHTSYQMQGCPKCQSSKNEMVIGKMLYNNDIKYEEQKTFKNCVNPKTNRRLKYDFYLPEQNILIEYNGKQHYQYIKRWHQNEQSLASQQFRDSIKKQYALSHGYKFLVIKYNENVKEMLKKHLSI